jgi:hypothetical protein
MGTIVFWLFTAFLLGLGLLGLVQAIREWQRARSRLRWPTTTGKVVASTAEARWNPELVDYWLEYAYTVGNQTYTSKTIGFGGALRPRSDKERIELQAYRVDSPVVVYYNPQNPQEAVIKRDIPWSQILILFFGGLIALIWALLLLVPAPG